MEAPWISSTDVKVIEKLMTLCRSGRVLGKQHNFSSVRTKEDIFSAGQQLSLTTSLQ